MGKTIFLVAITSCLMACRTTAPQMNPKGVLYQQNGSKLILEDRLEDAEAQLVLALEYNPSQPEALNGLGIIAHRRGDWQRALKFFREALDSNNDFAEAHNNAGAVLLKLRDYSAAEGCFKDALAIDPGYVNARYNLILVLLSLEKTDEAKFEMRKLIALAPEFVQTHTELSCLLLAKGCHKESH